MERGDVDQEKQGGDGGAYGGSHQNGCRGVGGSLEDQGTCSLRKEGGDPVHQVKGGLALQEHRPELDGIDFVKARFYVEKEGGNFPARALEGADLMGEGGDGVRRT